MEKGLTIKKERLPWIDWAKTICMCCVVLTHTYCFDYIRPFNYFDMPAFLLISGFLYKQVSYKEEIKKSFKGIIIPYLLFNLIISITYIILGKFEISHILNILTGNQEALDHYYTPLWFLVTILLIRIVCSIIPEKWIPKLIIPTLLISIIMKLLHIPPLHHDYFQFFTTIMCFPFFLFGVILKKYNGFNLPNKLKPFTRYSLICIILGCLIPLIRFNGFATIFHCATGKNVILYYIICFILSYTIIYLISKIFTKQSHISRTISSGTVLILGLQYIIIDFIFLLLNRNTLTAIITVLLVMIICFPLILLSQKYFPALIGGRSNKK